MIINQTITDFATLAIQSGGWMELDRIYLQNRILAMIGETTLATTKPEKVIKSSGELLDELIKKAKENSIISDHTKNIEELSIQLMDLMTPPPSVVNAFFAKHYEQSPKEATDYFYALNKVSHFIQQEPIEDHHIFTKQTKYGKLEFNFTKSLHKKCKTENKNDDTFNQMSSYPKCLLCLGNEGYKGRTNYPARTNFRAIRMNLDGESWSFQYHPMGLFNEHSIISTIEHKVTKMSKNTFSKLLNIVAIFPHYFVGVDKEGCVFSDADKMHDHYIAGRQKVPLEKAEIDEFFELTNYPLVNIGIVNWPLSVVRLQGPNQNELVEVASMIREKWNTYSSEKNTSQNENSMVAVARRREKLFELDLVLATNKPRGSISEQETAVPSIACSVNLLNSLGLNILPTQLVNILEDIESYIVGKTVELPIGYHVWADKIKEKHLFTKENTQNIIENELCILLIEELEKQAAFEKTENGEHEFKKFLSLL